MPSCRYIENINNTKTCDSNNQRLYDYGQIIEKIRIQTGSSMQNFSGSITLKLNATEKACIMLPNVNVINLRECLSVSPGVHLFSQVKTNNRTNDYMNSE